MNFPKIQYIHETVDWTVLNAASSILSLKNIVFHTEQSQDDSLSMV